MKSFFETKKGILLLNFLKYVFFFLMMYIFAKGGIANQIFPFSVAFFFAICWCEQNLLISSGLFVLSNFLATFSVLGLIESASAVVIVLLCFFIHKKIKKRISLILVGIYLAISQTMFLYYSISSGQILWSVLHILFAEIFMFACIKIFKVLLVKGIGFKLTIDECISLSIFFVAMGSGLATINPFDFRFINTVAVFFILLFTYIYEKSSFAMIVASCFGLGFALQTYDLSMIAIFVLYSLASISFKSTNKYFSILAILVTDIFLGLYFDAYQTYTYKVLISTIIGELLFVSISNGELAFLKVMFGERSGTETLRNMVNRSRDSLRKRMYSLSEAFDEMDRSFKNTIQGILPASEAKQMLKEEFISKVCSDCPQKHRCYRVLAKETDETINDIISAGLDKGKITLLDIPPFLSTRCNKTNIILSTINQLVASYKQYTYYASNVDTSKALVAEQFGGMSKLLAKLADETKELVTFDEMLEKKIVEELNFVNVFASEVYVFNKKEREFCCILTMRADDVQNPKLFEILNRNFGTNMKLYSTEASSTPGFVVCEFSPAAKYQCIYGSSGTNKFGNNVSGDSFSFINLGANKVLFAICDGMGSGENAQKMSDTTISLIENFYKADFDDETILSSVNKLLSMQMNDRYSTLDICVLNLSTALGDFVKVGAPCGYIKHADSTEILRGSGALPIGILNEIKPSIDKKILSENDIVVLCSDGIIDAFNDDEKLKTYINSIMSKNPQEIADQILNEAIRLNAGEPQDDMTVVAVRIMVNV